MNAGFENEFFLLKRILRYVCVFSLFFLGAHTSCQFNNRAKNLHREGKEEWIPADKTMYCSTSGFDAASSLLQEVNAGLHSLNIPLEQVIHLLSFTLKNFIMYYHNIFLKKIVTAATCGGWKRPI